MEEPKESPINPVEHYNNLLIELDQLLELDQHRLDLARHAIADKAIHKLSSLKLEELAINKIIAQLEILEAIKNDRP